MSHEDRLSHAHGLHRSPRRDFQASLRNLQRHQSFRARHASHPPLKPMSAWDAPSNLPQPPPGRLLSHLALFHFPVHLGPWDRVALTCIVNFGLYLSRMDVDDIAAPAFDNLQWRVAVHSAAPEVCSRSHQRKGSSHSIILESAKRCASCSRSRQRRSTGTSDGGTEGR